MRNLPVHWSEGMFLKPQHFQSAERHWNEVLDVSTRFDHPYYYGLRSIEISKEAIGNQQFQVVSCQARLRDGTPVVLDLGQDPDRLDLQRSLQAQRPVRAELKETFAKSAQVKVFLAVPKLRLGRANVAGATGGQDARFIPAMIGVPDESRGGGHQEIEFRETNVRLITSDDDSAGYEVLPIGQVKRASDEKALPLLDDDYIPPLLAIDAWPPLAIDIVRAIFDLVGQKLTTLAEQVRNRGITLSTQTPGDLERIRMLEILNEALGTLSCLTFASGVHPFYGYTELCRVVGQLSIFGAARRAPEFPRYDHDNLAYIFKWVKRQIEDLLNAVRDYEYEQEYFIGTRRGMQVTLRPKWLNAGWHWFVGVQHNNITADECRALLSAGNLDWKMGSAQQVDLLFERRAAGLELRPLTQAPRALPTAGGWLYYEVTRGNAAWNDVQLTQSLAMRFKTELLSNLQTLEGQRDLVVSSRGRQAVLQIAIFAVPPRES